MSHPLLIEDPFWTPPRVWSALIGVGYILLGLGFEGLKGTFGAAFYCAIPMACIWAPDALGAYTGFSDLLEPRITAPSPPAFIYYLGWALLLLPLVVGLCAMIVAAFAG